MAMAHWNVTNVSNAAANGAYNLEETDNGTGAGNGTYHFQNVTMEDSSAGELLQPPVMMPDPWMMQLQIYIRNLHLYYAPTVYCMALFGNSFSVVILTDTLLKKLSNTHYLIGIFVVELIHVLLQLHKWIEDNGWNTGILSIGGWCQFNTFATRITVFLSVWYTVFLSIDCYVCNSWPTLQRKLCTTWVARYFITGAAVVAIVVFFNISILYGTIEVGPRLVCVQLQIYKDTHDKLTHGDVIVNAVIPTLLILVFMALIIRYVCRNGRNTKNQYQQPICLIQNRTDQQWDQNGAKSSIATQKQPTINPSPRTNSTGFILTFLIVHISFCMPLDAYHFVQIVEDFVSPASAGPSLKGFLLDQILQYIKSAKRVLNVIVLLGAYPLSRAACYGLGSRIKQSIQGCRRHNQRQTVSDIEATTS